MQRFSFLNNYFRIPFLNSLALNLKLIQFKINAFSALEFQSSFAATSSNRSPFQSAKARWKERRTVSQTWDHQ